MRLSLSTNPLPVLRAEMRHSRYQITTNLCQAHELGVEHHHLLQAAELTSLRMRANQWLLRSHLHERKPTLHQAKSPDLLEAMQTLP